MNTTSSLEALRTFRAAVYATLGRERNTFLEVLDALLCGGPVPSLAHVSLAPAFRGGHGRLYRALAVGAFEGAALRALVATQPLADETALPAIFALDVSPWPRPSAVTSPHRGFCHHAVRAVGRAPVVPGWNYSWLAEITLERQSWTAPREVLRVPPSGNANAIALTQIQHLLQSSRPASLPSLPSPPPLVVCDAGYDAAQLALGLRAELAAGQVALLVRVRRDRCFYADPAPADARPTGRPRIHGALFRCREPRTWAPPTAELHTTDARYGAVRARAWAGLHGIPRDHAGRRRREPGAREQRGHVPIVRGTLLLVEVEHLPGHAPTTTPQPLWLFWQGAGTLTAADLDRLWRAYVCRFALEHTFHFLKQELNWVRPRLRSPAQADRWSWLVLLAYTLLRLARPLVADQRLPWERPLPPERLTPGRVRRAFCAVWAQVGTPAVAPQPRGRSPGRPRGRRSARAPRYAVVKAGAPAPA